jgi:hypothetical protein
VWSLDDLVVVVMVMVMILAVVLVVRMPAHDDVVVVWMGLIQLKHLKAHFFIKASATRYKHILHILAPAQ